MTTSWGAGPLDQAAGASNGTSGRMIGFRAGPFGLTRAAVGSGVTARLSGSCINQPNSSGQCGSTGPMSAGIKGQKIWGGVTYQPRTASSRSSESVVRWVSAAETVMTSSPTTVAGGSAGTTDGVADGIAASASVGAPVVEGIDVAGPIVDGRLMRPTPTATRTTAA